MIPIFAAPKRFAASLGKGRGSHNRSLQLPRGLVLGDFGRFRFSPSIQNFSSLPRRLEPFLFPREESDSNNSVKPVHSGSSIVYKRFDPVQLNLIGERESKWFTGKAPYVDVCPGAQANGYVHSLPQVSWKDGNITREQLQAYFDNTWTITEVLLAALQGEEAFMRPPIHELRHPMIFYYGHPAALYVNKLRVAGLLKEPINADFEVLFETGVDEMSWDDLSKNQMKWPSVSEVHAYRRQVYTAVSDVIRAIPDKDLTNMSRDSPLWALVMGFEHERIHIETSSVLLTELPIQYVRFPEGLPPYHQSAYESAEVVRDPVSGVHYPGNGMITVEAQNITLGKSASVPSFGWDNEYGRRSYDVPGFQASKFKITNGEFLEFVRDGGYANKELWSESGWKWRAYRNAKWPCFWVREGPQGLNHFRLRLIFDEVSMQWDWPVCVNLHEAAAYAKWASLKTKTTSKASGNSSYTSGNNKEGEKEEVVEYRIATELEHHAMRNGTQKLSAATVAGRAAVDHIVQSTSLDLLSQAGINANLSCSSMSPVDALPANERGFHDVFGNAWEWCHDHFSALPGFEVHPYYEDFSTPCFDGLHNVIMGGSFMSTGNEASIYSRFHFRPHFFQHASFRLVRSSSSFSKDDELITSDTDAPGPYVGNYPFRRSHKGMSAALDGAVVSQEDAFNVQMLKHYGTVAEAFALSKEFSSPSAQLKRVVADAAAKLNIPLQDARVLEIGCGVGGLSFEMAKEAKVVIGFDHNHDDIAIAKRLLNNESVTYTVRGDHAGDHRIPTSVSIGDVVKPGTMVDFRCADPMCLPAELQGFDIVVVNDVIDKVSTPGSLLGRLGGMRGLVRKGGLLTVLSTFNWSEQTTPRSLWLAPSSAPSTASFPSESASSCEDVLARKLTGEFTCVSRAQLPLFWQESSRDLRGRLFSVTQWKRI